MVWYPDAKTGNRRNSQARPSKSSRKNRAVTVPAVNSNQNVTANGSGTLPTATGQPINNTIASLGITSDDIALWAAVVTIIGDSLALLALLKAREENPDS